MEEQNVLNYLKANVSALYAMTTGIKLGTFSSLKFVLEEGKSKISELTDKIDPLQKEVSSLDSLVREGSRILTYDDLSPRGGYRGGDSYLPSLDQMQGSRNQDCRRMSRELDVKKTKLTQMQTEIIQYEGLLTEAKKEIKKQLD